MKKFKYKVLTAKWQNNESLKEIEKTLNKEGKDGWELVSTNKEEYPDVLKKGEEVLLILKKEVH